MDDNGIDGSRQKIELMTTERLTDYLLAAAAAAGQSSDRRWQSINSPMSESGAEFGGGRTVFLFSMACNDWQNKFMTVTLVSSQLLCPAQLMAIIKLPSTYLH